MNRELIPVLPKMNEQKEWSWKDQVGRSAGSVMGNIAEGLERGGNKERVTFRSFAKGSRGEFRSQLYRALGFDLITPAQFNSLQAAFAEITKMLIGFTPYLKSPDHKGQSFEEKQGLIVCPQRFLTT